MNDKIDTEELLEFNLFKRKPDAMKIAKKAMSQIPGAVAGKPGKTDQMSVIPLSWEGGKKHLLIGVDVEKGPFFKYRSYKEPTQDPEWFRGIMSNMALTAATGDMFSDESDLLSKLKNIGAIGKQNENISFEELWDLDRIDEKNKKKKKKKTKKVKDVVSGQHFAFPMSHVFYYEPSMGDVDTGGGFGDGSFGGE